MEIPRYVGPVLIGYGVFAVLNYMVAKATAGQLRQASPVGSLLTLNDKLLNLNVLRLIFGDPTAPLAPGTTPVVTQTDVVVAPTNVVPFPQNG